MAFNQKQDNKVMEILGTKEIRHAILSTDKGDLSLLIRKGETSYTFVLDAVPVSKETNTELMELLFPTPQPNIPTVNKSMDLSKIVDDTTHVAYVKETDVKKMHKTVYPALQPKKNKPNGTPITTRPRVR